MGTKKFLLDDSPEVVEMEVHDPNLGDQELAQGAHLIGITYEPRKRTLEFELEAGDHRIVDPSEVWTMEEPDGFVSGVEMVYGDGAREVVSIKRLQGKRRRAE